MSSSTTTNSSELVSMVPWLHFTSGDILFFQHWRPSSKAAVAGASIGLFMLALLERWLSAFRVVLGARWRHSAVAMKMARCSNKDNGEASSTSSAQGDGKDDKAPPAGDLPPPPPPPPVQSSTPLRPEGSINVPFILAHDLPRGAIYALQVLLGYSLMLAVMTFQAAYIISIVFGLGIGEMLFGRMGGRMDH